MRRVIVFIVALAVLSLCHRPAVVRAEVIWIEGEKPTKATVTRHPWWYDKVQKDQLSGGDYISHWDDTKPGEATYVFTPKSAGNYEFWVRANPTNTTLSYQLNGGEKQAIDTAHNQIDTVNIAENNAVDLRYIAWFKVGTVALKDGRNTITFEFNSSNHHHGSLDCFVLDTEPFTPNGILKPGQTEAPSASEDGTWFPFNPPTDPFTDSPIDLRRFNEKIAGDGGFIAAKDGEFIHGNTGEPIRFWGVNGPPNDMKDRNDLARVARMLAKHGVNLVRIHAGYFDEAGNVDPKKVQHAIDIVEAMKAQGIYCHFSTYFYLWFAPKPDCSFLPGYDGKTHPVAALFFSPDFQKQYREWYKALLTTPGERTGKRLIDDPAVSSLEVLNEDSTFFWTFNVQSMPGELRRNIETQFAQWCEKKYGSVDAALAKWRGVKTADDSPALGVLGIRPMWNIANERTPRDQDTAQFLVETQRSFYRDTVAYLRGLGFKGLITASNWITADAQHLGALEKYSYTVGDFIDRHGYFDSNVSGDSSSWSIRNGQMYNDRDAMRFDPLTPGKPRLLGSPVMDTHCNDMPSMLSETTFSRPNRYRSEAPLFFASYGSLQGSNAIEFFALDGGNWSVKPSFFMQPWTTMTPELMGQFPAAALVYRQRLIEPGAVLADVQLKVGDLLQLRGQPIGLDGEVNENQPITGNDVDPLACFAGRTKMHISEAGGESKTASLSGLVDRSHHTVTSTNGQLKLDYENGILRIDAPQVQGVSGNLAKAGAVELEDVSMNSPMDLGHIVAVSLDGQPLAKSNQILLQVASEEMNKGFKTANVGGGRKQILNVGQDPWMVKAMAGTVKLKRADAATMKVSAMDANGYVKKEVGNAAEVKLNAEGMYYLITK